MLISKKSLRKSEVFGSRFDRGKGGNFALRQYLRCREDFSAGLVHLVLQAVLLVTLLLFGRSVSRLFAAHGRELSGGYRTAALALVGAGVLALAIRIVRKVLELREIRRDLAGCLEEITALDDRPPE